MYVVCVREAKPRVCDIARAHVRKSGRTERDDTEDREKQLTAKKSTDEKYDNLIQPAFEIDFRLIFRRRNASPHQVSSVIHKVSASPIFLDNPNLEYLSCLSFSFSFDVVATDLFLSCSQ